MIDDETTGTRLSSPVFTDGPGRRSRRMRAAAYTGASACAAILGVVGVNLVTGPGTTRLEARLFEDTASEPAAGPGWVAEIEPTPVVAAGAPATDRWSAPTDDPHPAPTAAAPVPPPVDLPRIVTSTIVPPSASTTAIRTTTLSTSAGGR
ncbi:hypothetical protein PA7_38930 [Pseudonocardia asaccharolytica DSM 44247 = NBRC 16224]|uniref:Uncharacterized protein n=1 Tax=Pseudonocardia asaccharolytica DSM 44247 = NBRC 16224 TaxID=1123024 RepID=A0A511D5I3_9PSEU|nr:hypothetical protein PA7_38930 [Pseudonocardia asaccharolytica DSM 44247 = NBRC 16224]